MTDELCVAAEAALFFCHRKNAEFFVGSSRTQSTICCRAGTNLATVTDKKSACCCGSWEFQAGGWLKASKSLLPKP